MTTTPEHLLHTQGPCVFEMQVSELKRQRDEARRQVSDLIEKVRQQGKPVADAVELCAQLVENAWVPHVGGYPSGPELAALIRESLTFVQGRVAQAERSPETLSQESQAPPPATDLKPRIETPKGL